ncbi:MAG: response regulator [Candidatus Altiarchaeota archaeon]
MKRIIVIDDNDPVRESIMKTLVSRGYLVDGASDSMSGWKMVSDGNYDLILLDIIIPGLTTAEFVKKFRGRVGLDPHIKNTKLLFVTAVHLTESDKKTLIDGSHVVGTLEKPFTADELVGRVEEVLCGG